MTGPAINAAGLDELIEHLVEVGRAKHDPLNSEQRQYEDWKAREFYRKIIGRIDGFRAPVARQALPEPVGEVTQQRVTDAIRAAWVAGGFSLPDDVDSVMPFLARDALAAARLTPTTQPVGEVTGLSTDELATVNRLAARMGGVFVPHPDMPPATQLVDDAARFAYENAYPGKVWGTADPITTGMFRQRASYYVPAILKAVAAARLTPATDALAAVREECAKVAELSEEVAGFGVTSYDPNYCDGWSAGYEAAAASIAAAIRALGQAK